MNLHKMGVLTLCLLFSISATVTTGNATTTFGGSKIVAIDQDQRTMTFKTKEGQTWTLPVSDPDLLNRQPTAKDEPVTIEIDLNDRITNVVRLSEERHGAPRTETEDR